MMQDVRPGTVWTIGHSTHPIELFLEMLQAHRIETLADVRRFAGSRKNPQFSPESLRESLAGGGVGYLPLPALGGRRTPNAESTNDAWRNAAFRGYADYMQTAEYAAGFARLVEESSHRRVAIMCAEAVWWRCHRSLIADDLKVRGVTVIHIMSGSSAREHPFTSAARVVNGSLSYAATDQ